MKEDKLQELKAKFLEERKNRPKVERKWPYELFGIECGEGWKGLYQPIIDYIDKYNEDHEEKIEIHQIKEKFGGLCFYVNKKIDELRKMIEDAEAESYHTCEVCGKHINKPISENYWIYPMCKECFDNISQRREQEIEETAKKIREKRKMNSENSQNKS